MGRGLTRKKIFAKHGASSGSGPGGGEDLNDTLVIGNTTTLSAVFDSGAGSITTINNTGLTIDSPTGLISLADSAFGSLVLSMDAATGEGYFGDILGAFAKGYIQVSATHTTLAGPGNAQFVIADAGTDTLSLGSASPSGIINLNTQSPGTNIVLDNGAKTIDITTNNGTMSIEGTVLIDDGANTIKLTSTTIDDDGNGGGISFAATTGTIAFANAGISIGTTTLTNAALTTAAGTGFSISSGRTVAITAANTFGTTMTVSGGGKITMNVDSGSGGTINCILPVYADITAAGAAGLVSGDFFATTTTGVVICIP